MEVMVVNIPKRPPNQQLIFGIPCIWEFSWIFFGVYSTGVCWGSISFQAWNKEETPLVPCWSELQEPTNKVGETDNPKLVGGFNPSEKY